MAYKLTLRTLPNSLCLCLAISLLWADIASIAPGKPTVELELDPPRPRAGEEFELTARLSWEGPADAYYVKPPDLTPPNGFYSRGFRMDVTRRNGKTIRTYVYSLACDAPGDYSLDSIEFGITDKSSGETYTIRPETARIDVAEKPFLQKELQKARALPYSRYLGAGLLALGLILGLVAFLFFPGRKKGTENIEETKYRPKPSNSPNSGKGR